MADVNVQLEGKLDKHGVGPKYIQGVVTIGLTTEGLSAEDINLVKIRALFAHGGDGSAMDGFVFAPGSALNGGSFFGMRRPGTVTLTGSHAVTFLAIGD